MTVIKRFLDCQLPTQQTVLDTYERVKNLAVIDVFLRKASGYQFYNTSKFTLASLVADSENIESNFRDYLNGFSSNVQTVLAKFNFENVIKRMVESNTLYLVIKDCASQKGYLDPDKISAVACGYIFESLVRHFSKFFGEEPGAHFTSRDIIYLMTEILVAGEDLSLQENITVYDIALGTSQLLSCMKERIHDIDPDMEVTCFGQEFMGQSYAVGLAEMLIKGQNAENFRHADTLKEDCFAGTKMRFLLENPPFGTPWSGSDAKAGQEEAVKQEYEKGLAGRWGAGLPGGGDSQLLFMQSAIAKMDDKLGQAAIIENGSPLFTGGTASDESQVRRWLLENDLIEAIIAMPIDLFYIISNLYIVNNLYEICYELVA